MAKKKQQGNGRMAVLLVLMCLAILAVAALVVAVIYRMTDSGTSVSETPSYTGSEAPSAASDSAAATTTSSSATTTSSSATTTSKATTGTVSPASAKTYVQKDRSTWNLLLVNDYNPVPENYLSTFTMANYNGASKQCDSRIVEPLRKMLNDGNAANASFKLSAASLYRTEELQAKNYNNKVNYYKGQGYDQQTAESLAATVIKRPGQSEHNTGLCVDLLGAGYASLEQSFENTEAYKWLVEHCAEYGFILRYPKDKEDITSVIFEPWHYRYVGVEAATEIMERGICLEEYIAERGL